MARSVFYYHLKGLRNVDKYISEKEEIKSIFHEYKGRYGYCRVTAEVRNRDFIINHKTIKRLMDEMGLKCSLQSDTVHIKGMWDRLPPIL